MIFAVVIQCAEEEEEEEASESFVDLHLTYVDIAVNMERH